MKRIGIDSPPRNDTPGQPADEPSPYGKSERVQLVLAALVVDQADALAPQSQEPVLGFLTRDDYVHHMDNEPALVKWCIDNKAMTLLEHVLHTFRPAQLKIEGCESADTVASAINAAQGTHVPDLVLANCPKPRTQSDDTDDSDDSGSEDPGERASAVSAAIHGLHGQLASLSINHCDLLSSDDLKAIFEGIPGSTTLQSLSISHQSTLGDDAMTCLVQQLPTSTLTVLTLAGLSVHSGAALASAISVSGVVDLTVTDCHIGFVLSLVAGLIELPEDAPMPLRQLRVDSARFEPRMMESGEARVLNHEIPALLMQLNSKYPGGRLVIDCIVHDFGTESTHARPDGNDAATLVTHPLLERRWRSIGEPEFTRILSMFLRVFSRPAGASVMGEVSTHLRFLPHGATLIIMQHVSDAPEGIDGRSLLSLRELNRGSREVWDRAYDHVDRGFKALPQIEVLLTGKRFEELSSLATQLRHERVGIPRDGLQVLLERAGDDEVALVALAEFV